MSATTPPPPTIRVRVAHDWTAGSGWRVKETTVEVEWANQLDRLEEFVVPGVGGDGAGEATTEAMQAVLEGLLVQVDAVAHAEAARLLDWPDDLPRTAA